MFEKLSQIQSEESVEAGCGVEGEDVVFHAQCHGGEFLSKMCSNFGCPLGRVPTVGGGYNGDSWAPDATLFPTE